MSVLRDFLIIMMYLVSAAMPPVLAKAVYDQRQTGDLNVQIELKDLQVVALVNSELLNDYTDYDYFYDYADFTVKPPNNVTTDSTLEITEKNNITQSSESLPSQNLTASVSVDSTSPSTNNVTLTKDEEALNGSKNGTTSDTTSSINKEISNAESTSTASSTLNNDKSQPSEEDKIRPTFSAKPIHTLRSQKRCKSGYVPNGNGRCRRASRPWLTRLLP